MISPHIGARLAGLFAGKRPLPLEVQRFPGDLELNGLLKEWLKSQLGKKQKD
jgi:hypothetical protein